MYLQSDHLYSVSLRSKVYGTALSLKDLDFKKFFGEVITKKLVLFFVVLFLNFGFFCFVLFCLVLLLFVIREK